MNAYLGVLLVYSASLMALGIFVRSRVKSSSDFLVAGRRLGPGMIFTTFLAANIGASSTVGATGLGYRYGLSAWWWVGAASIGTLILSQTLGPRLWRIARANKLSTMGDYLELRFGRAVKVVIAAMLWAGTLTILAGQLIAISLLLHEVAGTPKWVGCVIGGVVAITYQTAGGMIGSAFVNIFELTVTMSGLLLAVPFAMHRMGGWSGITAAISANAGGSDVAWKMSVTGIGAKQIFYYIALLTPSFIISPGLVQKLYAARDERTVRVGVGLNSMAQALFAFAPALLGLCALAAFPHLANAELALPMVMKELLPKWLGMWALAAIFSAELSATGTILFMLSTSLTVDLYKTFVKPEIQEKELLFANRAASVLAGAMGILLAAVLPSIIAAVTVFYSLLAVALFVPVVAGLYSRRGLGTAALVSIVAAPCATLVALHVGGGRGWGWMSPQAIGILVAVVVMVGFRGLAPGEWLPGSRK